MSYTKNEIALSTLISNINNTFCYVGEDDDQIDMSKTEVKNTLTKFVVEFANSIEVEDEV